MREYHQKNKEKILWYGQEYRKKNREKKLRYDRVYLQKNREKKLLYLRAYAKKSREKKLQEIQENLNSRGLPPPKKYSTWKSVDEVRNFLENFAEDHHIQKWPEDWYRISVKQIQDAGGP
jgi:hypothetical protein